MEDLPELRSEELSVQFAELWKNHRCFIPIALAHIDMTLERLRLLETIDSARETALDIEDIAITMDDYLYTARIGVVGPSIPETFHHFLSRLNCAVAEVLEHIAVSERYHLLW